MRNASFGIGGQRERLRRRHDQIGRAEQPAIGERRQRRRLGGIALGRAGRHPRLDHRQFRVGQHALPFEVADAGLDVPGRHEAALRHLHDLRGALPHLAIRREAEGAGPARAMAGRAGLEDHRRHVAGKDRRAFCAAGMAVASLGRDRGRASRGQARLTARRDDRRSRYGRSGRPRPSAVPRRGDGGGSHLRRSERMQPTARVVFGSIARPARRFDSA